MATAQQLELTTEVGLDTMTEHFDNVFDEVKSVVEALDYTVRGHANHTQTRVQERRVLEPAPRKFLISRKTAHQHQTNPRHDLEIRAPQFLYVYFLYMCLGADLVAE